MMQKNTVYIPKYSHSLENIEAFIYFINSLEIQKKSLCESEEKRVIKILKKINNNGLKREKYAEDETLPYLQPSLLRMDFYKIDPVLQNRVLNVVNLLDQNHITIYVNLYIQNHEIKLWNLLFELYYAPDYRRFNKIIKVFMGCPASKKGEIIKVFGIPYIFKKNVLSFWKDKITDVFQNDHDSIFFFFYNRLHKKMLCDLIIQYVIHKVNSFIGSKILDDLEKYNLDIFTLFTYHLSCQKNF